MPAVMPSKLMDLSRASDPKEALKKAVGEAVDHLHPMGAQLLVATYIEPERTKGGIIRVQSTVQEALWQGSLGLVLKKGPWAFEDDERLGVDWKGQNVEVGEWVVFRYSSAWEQHLNGVSVRFVDDRDIKAKIDDPQWLTSKPLIVTE